MKESIITIKISRHLDLTLKPGDKSRTKEEFYEVVRLKVIEALKNDAFIVESVETSELEPNKQVINMQTDSFNQNKLIQ